eukprot:scaffold93872_cov65-Attheya_sp.AAC.1
MQGHDMGELGTRTDQGPRGTDAELLGAGNGRQALITIKVALLGSMLGLSALFNMGYRHGANGNGKGPRSVTHVTLDLLFRGIGKSQFYINLPYATY